MTDEQYIDHEVRLRVLHEVQDIKFRSIEHVVKSVDSKLNWLITLFISSIFIPIVLRIFGLV